MADGGRANWMESAFKNAGKRGHSLHAFPHVPADENIPAYRVKKAEQSKDPHMRQMAQLAANAGRKRKNYGE